MNKFFFIVEQEAFEGVKRIVKKVALDFEKVCGVLPCIIDTYADNADSSISDYNIVFATIGKSTFVNKLINENKFDPSAVSGRNEVFQIKFIDNACGGNAKTLLITGSDKRGTIYGMFALSEYIGVSPLHFWGDAEPVSKDNIEITKEIETISKEPSVKYRGFFINDEWPCFGSWTFGRFGGFTSEMYDHVFELLLRLKGNYLWPAMWTSSFPLDGPGSLNEELADIYGVVMGASHHEPCLRASEEWDKVRGESSEYGNDWNYYTNKNGLLKYWEDALKRSGKYEKIITIGMRGERDSSMLPEGASLNDNIDLLKDIIKNQRELIKKYVNHDISKARQTIALYKEVEEYYYGSGDVEGLKNWDGLDGVICMLCEDNFGFMRTLPTEEIRGRNGGFGMYYHFDYHGGPVSYEWMPSTSFERTWEQMCMAYDYGVRDIWIVNAGDLKFNEVPLSYFMELAYDFENWGSKSPNSIDRYTKLWLEKTFPSAEPALREKIGEVLQNYIGLNAMRRPEALNDHIYHPCHYLETDRMLSLALKIEKTNKEIMNALAKKDEKIKNAYYSMIYFPAEASVNLLKMHLFAGKNRHYAKQGKKAANDYASLVTRCIENDRTLANEFALFKDGKWKGMEKEQHIGFVKWNDDNYRYPLRYQVEPAHKPRMAVSRKDRENIYSKTYGSPEKIIIDDFLYAGNDEVILEIANDGISVINYIIEPEEDYAWLEILTNSGVKSLNGTVEAQEEIIIRCDRTKLGNVIQNAKLLIKDGETTIAVEINAKNPDIINLPKMTFLQNNGVIAIEANHYYSKLDVIISHNNLNCGFIFLENYGRSGFAAKSAGSSNKVSSGAADKNSEKFGGMKVYPAVVDFPESEPVRPSLSYRFLIEEKSEYTIEVWTTPSNSVRDKRPLRFMLTSSGKTLIITTVPAEFKAGNPQHKDWCQGVLDNIRVTKASLTFGKGVQEISIGAMEAGFILERILIYKKDFAPLESYLGPPESYYIK
ncbi:MAG: glycosyl hydrolase 115 family protein [Treponema sp.]|nr:glycosyl hydrolase 115 family protein [Treponema sp.]